MQRLTIKVGIDLRLTTGSRKTTVSSRKQLPNPYVAMGADPNSQRGLFRGKVKSVFPPVTGQENPAVLQQAGFVSSRQNVQHHSAVMAIVTRGIAMTKIVSQLHRERMAHLV
ncbi:hypothetical protein R1flu_023581 [Riccia fluitans]|uniref:Uncharacterized protein n=1 Tax=Riccia fluitans TaxID=41844 RepID=A0ABD1XSH3_9MARC